MTPPNRARRAAASNGKPQRYRFRYQADIRKKVALEGVERLVEVLAIMREGRPNCSTADKVLTLQAGKPVPQLRMILAGSAGGGNTAYAMMRAMPLTCRPYSTARVVVANAAFGGASSQYAAGRMNSVLQFTCETGVAKPSRHRRQSRQDREWAPER